MVVSFICRFGLSVAVINECKQMLLLAFVLGVCLFHIELAFATSDPITGFRDGYRLVVTASDLPATSRVIMVNEKVAVSFSIALYSDEKRVETLPAGMEASYTLSIPQGGAVHGEIQVPTYGKVSPNEPNQYRKIFQSNYTNPKLDSSTVAELSFSNEDINNSNKSVSLTVQVYYKGKTWAASDSITVSVIKATFSAYSRMPTERTWLSKPHLIVSQTGHSFWGISSRNDIAHFIYAYYGLKEDFSNLEEINKKIEKRINSSALASYRENVASVSDPEEEIKVTIVDGLNFAGGNVLGFHPVGSPTSVEGVFATADGSPIFSVKGFVKSNSNYPKDIEYSYDIKKFEHLCDVIYMILHLQKNDNAPKYHPSNYNCVTAAYNVGLKSGIATMPDGKGTFFYTPATIGGTVGIPILILDKANPYHFGTKLVIAGGKDNRP